MYIEKFNKKLGSERSIKPALKPAHYLIQNGFFQKYLASYIYGVPGTNCTSLYVDPLEASPVSATFIQNSTRMAKQKWIYRFENLDSTPNKR